MSKGGWARLIKQQQQQVDIFDHHHNGSIHSKEQEQQQHRLIAQLQSMNVNSCCINTSTASTVSTTSATSTGPSSGSILQVALHDQGVIKASKLLQVVRKWRSQSPRQITARRRSSTPTPRSSSCKRLGLMPLSCVTFSSSHSHSDDEDDDDKDFVSDQSRRSTAIRVQRAGAVGTSQASTRRALSCPRIGSPLGLCTPFASMQARCEDGNDEELECFKPYNEEESIKLRPSISCASIRLNDVSKAPSTPKGYLALYVGEERRRFLVKANLLNHPLFGILLDKAKQEFGFDQKGPLNIPCEIAFFQHIMLLVESNDPSYRNADHSSILLHFNSSPNLQAATAM